RAAAACGRSRPGCRSAGSSPGTTSSAGRPRRGASPRQAGSAPGAVPGAARSSRTLRLLRAPAWPPAAPAPGRRSAEDESSHPSLLRRPGRGKAPLGGRRGRGGGPLRRRGALRRGPAILALEAQLPAPAEGAIDVDQVEGDVALGEGQLV